MNELNNQYVELTKMSEALGTRAGSLVKISFDNKEIRGVLGLYDDKDNEAIFDVLIPDETLGVIFCLEDCPKSHEPNESFEWYKHNRRDIVSRLKLLEVSR